MAGSIAIDKTKCTSCQPPKMCRWGVFGAALVRQQCHPRGRRYRFAVRIGEDGQRDEHKVIPGRA